MSTKTGAGQTFDRQSFDSLLKRRLFFTEAFEIYRKASNFSGDNRGLYDYGPPGCALQANIVDLWRKHFVLEEDMLELDCTALTPEDVFRTSGHVDRFSDWMCKDPIKGEYLRADHLVETVLSERLASNKKARAGRSANNPLLPSSVANKEKTKFGILEDATVQEYEDILAKIDNFDGPDLAHIIKRLDVRNPDGGNEVLPPVAFNLMFKSSIGPSTAAPIYLRPETAQGQFLNFRKLLEYNQNTMPFASASIGKSYRNEISPRSGVLRVREFLMAEIEHFVDPQSGKKHPRFQEIGDIQLPLLDQDTQLAGRTELKTMTISDAVEQKIVENETLGYFLARISAFLLKIGVHPDRLRFRQHLPNEMAHYACDCWDAELLTSYGWIECVGCADRSAYDLSVHMRRTGEELVVREPLPEPIKVEEWQTTLDKSTLGRTFKKDSQLVARTIANLDQETLAAYSISLDAVGEISLPVQGLSDSKREVKLDQSMLSIARGIRVETVREYVPNVIEPSFGIGRILYSLLEHVYWHRRNDVARGVLSLPLAVAPTKVLIVPLSSNAVFDPIIRKVSRRLRKLEISNRVDGSGASIGKRYSRNDELGTPLGITVDFDTVEDGSITLRERDSTLQVRASEDEIITAVEKLVNGSEDWAQVSARLPLFSAKAEE